MKSAYDLHRLPEDERIRIIGETASAGEVVAVLLEKDNSEKIVRYITKITERFPTVRLIARSDGPVSSVVTLKFGLKATQ